MNKGRFPPLVIGVDNFVSKSEEVFDFERSSLRGLPGSETCRLKFRGPGFEFFLHCPPATQPLPVSRGDPEQVV